MCSSDSANASHHFQCLSPQCILFGITSHTYFTDKLLNSNLVYTHN